LFCGATIFFILFSILLTSASVHIEYYNITQNANVVMRSLLVLYSRSFRNYSSLPTRPSNPWIPLLPRLRSSIPFLSSLVLGLTAGTFLTTTILPYIPLEKSDDEKEELERLNKAIDSEFKVKIFRGKCVAAGRTISGLKDDEEEWREIFTTLSNNRKKEDSFGKVRSAEMRFEDAKRRNKDKVEEREREIIAAALTTNEINDGGMNRATTINDRLEEINDQAKLFGLEDDMNKNLQQNIIKSDNNDESNMVNKTLAGSGCLGVERVFWNGKDQELVAVVWIGKGLSGWPGVAHGGLLATILSEKSRLAASLLHSNQGQESIQQFTIEYRKPTQSGDFYLIRSIPRMIQENNLIEVDSKLETMQGKLCVDFTAKIPLVSDKPIREATVNNSSIWKRLTGL